MRKATTGQMIAQSLVDHGVDTIFGIPGAHMYDFNDALYALRDKLRFIHTRHEQGAGYMAYGYAKSSGRVGAYTVVPGPGVLNSGAALCTAYGANAPVLCVTGNIMSHLIGRGRGQLHELPDQLATLRGLTKAAECINHPSEAAAIMAGALHADAACGRQGPGGGRDALGRVWRSRRGRGDDDRRGASRADRQSRFHRGGRGFDRPGEAPADHGRRRRDGGGLPKSRGTGATPSAGAGDCASFQARESSPTTILMRSILSRPMNIGDMPTC